jgi:hypothetical protein
MRASALLAANDRFRETRMPAMGQQATFADASRVFVLSVRNREANQALPGQERSFLRAGLPPRWRSFQVSYPCPVAPQSIRDHAPQLTGGKWPRAVATS